MKRLIIALILIVCFATSGCDGVFVGVNTDGRSRSLVATGTVSVVNFSVVDGTTTVTIVTLIDNGIGSDFAFCGDLRPKFPLNSAVQVTFAPGATCNSNVVVVLIWSHDSPRRATSLQG